MRANLRQVLRVAMIAAPLTLAMAACGRDAAAPDSEPLDEAEALLIGREIATEVQGMAASFGLNGFLRPPGDLGFGFHPRPGSVCPTFTPFPPSDSDGDGVPDALTLSFILPACSFTGRDGALLEITGTVEISDPSTTEFGFRVVVTRFQHKVTRPDASFVLRRLDGVVQVLRSETAFSARDTTTAVHESSDGHSVSLAKAWLIGFVADPSQSIDGWRHLPSGTLTVNGSTIRTRGQVAHSLDIRTLTGLHFDATCDAEQKFDAGVLIITKLHPEHSVTIRVEFTGCGEEPVVTLVPPPGA